MHSESNNMHELQSENLNSEMQSEIIVCPNCKMEGPKGIYCLNCGYPLYLKEQKQSQSEATENFSIDLSSEPVKAETISETVLEPEVSPQNEKPVGVLKETTLQDMGAEVESEPAKTVTLSDAVRARAYSLAKKYGSFRNGSWTSEIERAREDTVNIKTEKIEDIKSPEMIEAQEQTTGLAPTFKPDPILKEMMENFIKSVSLELWFVNLLKEGNIEEEHFNKLFEGYVNRSELFMNCRSEMLENVRDMDSIERALTEAKVNLAELEMKKNIGDISGEEYKVKAPALKWDICKYEDEISKRNREIAFLENITNVMLTEEIVQMKEMAENCQDEMDSLEKSNKIASETAVRVKASLERILACLEGSDV